MISPVETLSPTYKIKESKGLNRSKDPEANFTISKEIREKISSLCTNNLENYYDINPFYTKLASYLNLKTSNII